jgi:pimeloyl-ACP methyl ester carboxylesterase
MTMASETPTIVLVHGAWADATGFDPEIRALRDRGFTAIGFANPLRDLAGDATYLAEFLRTLTGPIVLVGHSYGGNVISMAATGNDQVKALVYLNGWMCDQGESQQQLLERLGPMPSHPPPARMHESQPPAWRSEAGLSSTPAVDRDLADGVVWSGVLQLVVAALP